MSRCWPPPPARARPQAENWQPQPMNEAREVEADAGWAHVRAHACAWWECTCVWGALPGGVQSLLSLSLCLSSFPDQPPAFPFSHSLLHQFSLDMVSMVF